MPSDHKVLPDLNRPDPPTAGPGRPRDPAKHMAILGAARMAFFGAGFNAATIEDIAHRAGVSKVTIYNRFGDKEALFEAVVRAQAEYMLAAIAEAAAEGAPLADQLNGFGERLLAFLFDADHVRMESMLALEFQDRPDLGQRFFAAGPGNCRTQLAGLLQRTADVGDLVLTDPIDAAEDLMALWKGFLDFKLRVGVAHPPGPVEIADRVRRGTALFLKLYGRGA